MNHFSGSPKFHKKKGFNALEKITAGFAIIILIGSLLLSLPIASADGKSIGRFNALFTATSAICVTGLTVVDTARAFSRFGHVVILILIQMGGLGFMTFATLIFSLMGKTLTLRERMVARESLNETQMNGLTQRMRWVALATFSVEAVGAVFLAFWMIPRFGLKDGLFYAVFHAVSAFCNAGFDLFGNFSSFTEYCGDWYLNGIVMLLVILGGLGFGLLKDLCVNRRWRLLKLHTKIVLPTYGALFIFGFLFNLIIEWNRSETLGSLAVDEKILAAMFQSITLRTAGFNTISQKALHPATKLVNCALMFIGAAPASTGGGIKVTTFAIPILLVRMVMRGESSINVFGRRLEATLVQRAVTIITLAMGVVAVDIIAILLLQPNMDILDIAYECISDMGTVGISAVGTASLKTASKVLLILTMYIGRIGPLSVALALARKQEFMQEKYRYPKERLMIG